ncbi:hypothetical protein G7Y89_g8294 [Cudoniella acicularis]|uniref:Uncharacterized protein n=1 Tax=Cudoniella acicularis TaxID=354080 RepID=A0A8H4W169_9HELO|nr:hypothetical protein G7Y89_g8294 [Cudoniella acicularis]
MEIILPVRAAAQCARDQNSNDPEAVDLRQTTSLETLPVEIQIATLQYLPDVPSRYSVVRSPPIYHQSYLEQQRSILASVLENEITLKVLLEARFVLEAPKIKQYYGQDGLEEVWTHKVVQLLDDFKLQQHPNNTPLLHELFDLETLIKISQLQSLIRALAIDFYERTLPVHPITREILIFHLNHFLQMNCDEPNSHIKLMRREGIIVANDNDDRYPNAAWEWEWEWEWRPDPSQDAVDALRFKYFLRSWGYMMWDKDRLDKMGILERQPASYGPHGPKMRMKRDTQKMEPLIENYYLSDVKYRCSHVRNTIQNKPASLEGLPVELRVAILHSLSDMPTLSALVRSSPLYHQAYVGRRQMLLASVLSKEMTPKVLLESRFALDAQNIKREDSDETWTAEIRAFVKNYKFRRNENDPLPSELFDLETLVTISQIQSSLRALAADFYVQTLSRNPATGVEISEQSMSPSELGRIYRACYRFEIFCFLFASSANLGSRQDTSYLFFADFESWEVEEICCLKDYAYRRYDTVFRTWLEYGRLTETLLSKGLTFLSNVIRAPGPAEKVLLMENTLGPGYLRCSSGRDFLTKALQRNHDSCLPRSRDEAQKRTEIAVDDHDYKSPNAAWPWSISFDDSSRNYPTAFYGKESFRSWGYVMWDKKRVDELGVMEKAAGTYKKHGPILCYGALLSDYVIQWDTEVSDESD